MGAKDVHACGASDGVDSLVPANCGGEDGFAPLSDWNAPNPSSSPNKSTFGFAAEAGAGAPRMGKEPVWGSGDGGAGAGHCPGRAAARSMRLSVRWCELARASTSCGDRIGCGFAGALGGCSASAGRGDLDSGRGGEGVRRPDAGLARKSSKLSEDFCGVRSDWSEWKLESNPEPRLRAESRLVKEASSMAPKSSLSGSAERG